MDTFIVIIDILVVLLYSALIALISPYMMRFLQTRNCDRLFQLIPVLSIIFISSVIIFFGYGGSPRNTFLPVNKYHLFYSSVMSTDLNIPGEKEMEREVR